MKYLLDTNICIYLIKRKPTQILARFQELKPSYIGISSITIAKLEYGVSKSQQQQKNRDALIQFLVPLEIVEFDHTLDNLALDPIVTIHSPHPKSLSSGKGT